MNTPQPSSPAHRTAEHQALSLELAPTAIHERKALHALAKEEAADDTPPLPDHLKNRWREKFGKAERTVAVPSFSQRLAAVLFGSGFGRAAVAMGCVVAGFLAVNHFTSQGNAPQTADQLPVLRNGGTVQVADKGVAILLVSKDDGKTFAGEWSGQAVQAFSTEEAAQTAAKALNKAVLANELAASVKILVNGKPVQEIAVGTLSSEPAANLAAAVEEALQAASAEQPSQP